MTVFFALSFLISSRFHSYFIFPSVYGVSGLCSVCALCICGFKWWTAVGHFSLITVYYLLVQIRIIWWCSACFSSGFYVLLCALSRILTMKLELYQHALVIFGFSLLRRVQPKDFSGSLYWQGIWYSALFNYVVGSLNLMIWKVQPFGSVAYCSLKLPFPSAVLELTVVERLFTTTHCLNTNSGSKCTLALQCRLNCASHLFICKLAFFCGTSILYWRFSFEQCGLIST